MNTEQAYESNKAFDWPDLTPEEAARYAAIRKERFADQFRAEVARLCEDAIYLSGGPKASARMLERVVLSVAGLGE